MNKPKKTQKSRAKRKTINTAVELPTAGGMKHLESVLGIPLKLYELELTKGELEQDKELDDRIRSIMKNPEVFFGLDGSFGDEEILAARTSLAGKDWHEVFLMAMAAEKKKLLDQDFSPAQAESLVQAGWAWKYEQKMIVARDGSILANLKPSQCIRMVLVHQGFRWEPSPCLASLARFELDIPSSVEIGNAKGSHYESRKQRVMQITSFAFNFAKHPDEHLQAEARDLVENCSELLNLLENGGDLRLVSAAMNVATQNTMLSILMDPEMVKSNRRQFAIYKNAKPDPTGVRAAIKKAVLAVYERENRFPSRDQILKELDPIPSDDGRIHLMQKILTPRQFDRLLEGIRKTESWRWPRGPENKRGRPRKK